jgi:hypothetical protein
MPSRRAYNACFVKSPSTGLIRRTYAGKAWGVIVQENESAKPEMLIFKNEETARRVCSAMASGPIARPLVHYVEKLETIEKGTAR